MDISCGGSESIPREIDGTSVPREIDGTSFPNADSKVLQEEAFDPPGHVNSSGGKPCVWDGISKQAENIDSFETKMCINLSNSLCLATKKSVQKCATFPSFGETRQDNLCCKGAHGISNVFSQDPDLKTHGSSTYERSMSFPTTVKLVSAMKGSRAKNSGTSPVENLHVKWAPDVYDPPVTSLSHSVNHSYQQRPKSRKKGKNKQKQKGRASRGNCSDKKNCGNSVQNKPVLQAPRLKDASPPGNRSTLEKFDKHETEVLDYGISNQEAKCGSTFLRKTVAEIHFSAAEAS